jgi:hypothetical protein
MVESYGVCRQSQEQNAAFLPIPLSSSSDDYLERKRMLRDGDFLIVLTLTMVDRGWLDHRMLLL